MWSPDPSAAMIPVPGHGSSMRMAILFLPTLTTVPAKGGASGADAAIRSPMAGEAGRPSAPIRAFQVCAELPAHIAVGSMAAAG